jgi:hypothetical protein
MMGVSLAFYFVCSLIPFRISPLVQTIARIEFYARQERESEGDMWLDWSVRAILWHLTGHEVRN